MLSFTRAATTGRLLITSGLMALSAPLLAWASLRCVEGMFNTPHLWIPETHERRVEFDSFAKRFESPATVVISWPACTVDDPRLADLEAALTSPEHDCYDRRHAALFDRVVTGHTVLRQLMARPLGLSRETAIDRLRGALVSRDGESTCAVIVLTELGGYERREAIERILDTAGRVCDLDHNALRLAGPPVDGVAIDNAGVDTMICCALPSALVSLLFCWWCLRAWQYALVVLAAGAFGEALCLALAFWSGTTMNAILVLMPPLVFVLTIAAGVHLVNYYFDEAEQRGIEDAPRRTLQVGWYPCALATATTAVGLGSLLVSSIEPVRTFGGFSTIGVIATLLLLFLLLPGVMEWFPVRYRARRGRERSTGAIWDKWSRFVTTRPTLICLAAMLLSGALGCGLLSLRTSVELRDLFSPSDRILDDYQWLERQLGPTASVEVILHFRADSQVSFNHRLLLVRAVGSQLKKLNDVEGVISAATFALPVRRGGGARQIVRQTVSRSRFRQARYLYSDETGERWRVSARVPALGDLDYERLLGELNDQVTPVVNAFSEGASAPVGVTVTGAIPLIYYTQRALLTDLINSFLCAFALVAVVMVFVLRSVRAGLLVMIPNLFPTAIIFGLMGWLQLPVDIGTVMTASIALGIAVVDTLHFLTWFRREVSAGHSPPEAVRRAYAHCANAMVQTSVICGVGMLVFVFSSFVPAIRFAWMVFLLLIAALLGDLVILPALLASPLGRSFIRRR